MNEKIIFEKLPTTVEDLKTYELNTPFQTAALTVASLDVYSKNKDMGIEMLNYLKGPVALSNYELSFLKDRFMGKDYVPRSYFEGSTPDNNYTPSIPYSITVTDNAYSYSEEGYAKLYVQSSGADSARPIKLRAKDNVWYLWEQMILSDIRKPAKDNVW